MNHETETTPLRRLTRTSETLRKIITEALKRGLNMEPLDEALKAEIQRRTKTRGNNHE